MDGLVRLLFARTRPSPAAARRVSRALVALGVLALAFLFANLLSFRYGRDQGIYGVVAETMSRGGAPYKDAWDFKPPAIFFVFAVSRALFGDGAWGIRLLETLCWATVPVAFARIVARRGGDWRLGFAGGVLATYIHVRTEYWHTSQPETFGAVCLVWALAVVSTRPWSPPSRAHAWRWAVAGALFATAGLLKPPLGGGLLLLLPAWFAERAHLLRPEERARRFALLAGALLAGAAVPVAATLVYFVSKGALPDLVDTLGRFAPQYTKLGTSPRQLPSNFLRAARETFFYFSPLLGAALLVATPVVSGRMRREIGATTILATALLPWVGVALQGKFFPYHYDGCLPFVCLFAVAGYAAIFERLARWRAPGVLVAGAAAAILFGLYDLGPYINPDSRFWDRVPLRVEALLYPSRRPRLADAMTSEGDVRSAENRRLADWLRAETPATESVYVWGFEPVVYLDSGRRPASRYVYDVPQRVPWSREATCRVLQADLLADPPSAVAVEKDDRFVDVTGDLKDSAETLDSCPWLRGWLSLDFTRAWGSAKFDVYVRRAPSAVTARNAPPLR